MGKNVIHAYIGCGKGKTTAAFGLAVRALGYGKKVCAHQFLKEGSSGENMFFKNKENIDIFCHGIKGFYFSMSEEEKQSLKRKTEEGFARAFADLKSGKYFLVILDEVLGAIELGLIKAADLANALYSMNINTNAVITGRILPKELCEDIDLITEMRNVKHYYDKGVELKQGIEY